MSREELIKEARRIGYIIAGEYVGHLEASGKDFGDFGADSIDNCFKIMSIVEHLLFQTKIQGLDYIRLEKK